MTNPSAYEYFRIAIGQLHPSAAFAILPPYVTKYRILELAALGALLYFTILPSVVGILFFLAAFLLLYRVRITALLIGIFWSLFWPTLLSVMVFLPLFSRGRDMGFMAYLAVGMGFVYIFLALINTRVLPHVEMNVNRVVKRRHRARTVGNVIEFPSKGKRAFDENDLDVPEDEWIH